MARFKMTLCLIKNTDFLLLEYIYLKNSVSVSELVLPQIRLWYVYLLKLNGGHRRITIYLILATCLKSAQMLPI